jgi:hypothetical protein
VLSKKGSKKDLELYRLILGWHMPMKTWEPRIMPIQGKPFTAGLDGHGSSHASKHNIDPSVSRATQDEPEMDIIFI